jgi:hypothetical protein
MLTVHIDVYDTSLSRKWLTALNNIIRDDLHLEKNYCFLGFPNSQRSVDYLCTQMNQSVAAINNADLGYVINDHFSPADTIAADGRLDHDRMNQLHRYFEDLQGVSGAMSPYYTIADHHTKWHIRQLNLLCHEFESLVLSIKKQRDAPEWQRPSQLMCWLRAPRFVLDEQDYESFGIETINRKLGGVHVGVNKAIGKSHWEVFNDEGRSVDELTTTSMRSQTEAAGDFDIEWANDPGKYHWQIKQLAEFRQWLIDNGFDPEDKSLTIGHPQVAQVDLTRSFGTDDYREIWAQLEAHLDVYRVRTSWGEAVYDYRWDDADYAEQQVIKLRS